MADTTAISWTDYTWSPWTGCARISPACDLLAQYGWTNLATAEIYTRGIDRRRLGIETSRIVADQIGNITAPHPVSGEGMGPESETKSNTKK